MLRILGQRITLILIFSIGNRALRIEPGVLLPFLIDVKDYYKSSGIFLLLDDNYEGFSTLTNIVDFLKQFSSQGIMSQTMRYSKLKEKSDFYLSQHVQSLFIVFITSRTNLENFFTATDDHDMSFHTWLIIFVNRISEEADALCRSPEGNPFHLNFDSRVMVKCYGDPRIYKWFSIYDNRTEILNIGIWSAHLGFVYQRDYNYYDRRYDLSGKTLRIATHTNVTSIMNGKMTGFLEGILRELQGFMNFSVTRVRESDAFGKWNQETGKWSGLIGFLTEGEVDLVLAPVTMSKTRLDFIAYTRPLRISPNRIYMKLPSNARVPFRAISAHAWFTLITTLTTSSLASTFIRFVVREFKSYPRLSINDILEHCVSIWGIYCQQGVPEFPKATSLRLAYFIMLLLTVINWAIFSANITSYLTVSSPSLSFSDTEGFVKDGTYRLIVLQNSSDQDIILSGKDPILTTLRPFLKSIDELPQNPFDGFEQVCNERVGFYASDAVLKGVSAYIPCPLTYIETGQVECLAIALPKRSPYVGSINYNLRKLSDCGLMKKLYEWYFQETSDITDQRTPIGFRGILPLLGIIVVGFIVSILILMIEHLCAFCRKRQIKSVKFIYY